MWIYDAIIPLTPVKQKTITSAFHIPHYFGRSCIMIFEYLGLAMNIQVLKITNLGVWPEAEDLQTSVFYKSLPTASAGQK